MRHPFEKFVRGELLAILLSILFGLLTLILGHFLLLIFCFYLVAASLFFDALFSMYTNNTAHALKQFIRSILLFLLATFIMIKL